MLVKLCNYFTRHSRIIIYTLYFCEQASTTIILNVKTHRSIEPSQRSTSVFTVSLALLRFYFPLFAHLLSFIFYFLSISPLIFLISFFFVFLPSNDSLGPTVPLLFINFFASSNISACSICRCFILFY
jgi:hypothetical protein